MRKTEDKIKIKNKLIEKIYENFVELEGPDETVKKNIENFFNTWRMDGVEDIFSEAEKWKSDLDSFFEENKCFKDAVKGYSMAAIAIEKQKN